MNLDVIIYGIDFYNKLFNFDYQQCYDWDKFVNSKSFKILIVREQTFFDNYQENLKNRIKEYRELVEFCDLLIIYCDDLHAIHFNTNNSLNMFSELLLHPKIYTLTAGKITENENYINKNLTTLFQLNQVVKIYKDLDFKLAELNPFSKKEFYFDALLGHKKIHRDFVYYNIIRENLKNKFILSYTSNPLNNNWYKDEDVNYDELEKYEIKNSSININYYGKYPVFISQIIPIDVYNKTCYSIITETDSVNGICFPTEKTAKPIIAKRLFVMFSGQYFLKTLKEYGFKTFSEIIDEDYDHEENNHKRWQMAWESVKQLLEMDQEYVLEKVKPIVEHNFNHLMNFKFDDFVKEQCTEILLNRYNEST